MNWDKLKEPFEPQEIEWRVQQGGVKNDKPWAKVVPYVTSRGIQDRLDSVCGVAGWQTRMKPDAAGVICELGINIIEVPDGPDEWIWRADGAPYSDIEAYKGAISGALKRAAVHFGIGRYLYGLKAGWAEFVAERKGTYRNKLENKWFDWNPPALPEWALPGADPGKGPAFPSTTAPAPPSDPKAEDKGKGEGKEERPVEAPGVGLGLTDQAKDIIRELDLCLTVKDVEAWLEVPGNTERVKQLDAHGKEEVSNHGAALKEYLWFTDTLKSLTAAAEIRKFSVDHANSLSKLKEPYRIAVNKLALELKARL